TVCKVVVAVVGIIAMIIGGPILGAIVLVAALVVLADTLYKYSQGQASLWDVAFAALDCIPGGKGITSLGKLAKGLKEMKNLRGGMKAMSLALRGLRKAGMASLRSGAENIAQRARALAGRCPGGDPIDMVSGEMLMYDTDVELPGVLSLALKRTHISTYREGRCFGRSWASTFDERVELDDEGLLFAAEDGMVLPYPVPRPGGPTLPQAGPRWPLEWDGPDAGGLHIFDPALCITRHFTAVDEPMPGMPYTMMLSAITDRNGNRVDFDRTPDGMPVAVRHTGGYHVAVETADGLVTGLHLRIGEGEDVQPLLRYGYSPDGDLVEIYNSSGLPFRFTYDDQARVTSWTDRNGSWYRFTYDEEDRCVAGQGAGGFLDCAISYDPVRRTTTYTNSLGSATQYHYDELLHLVRVTDAAGREEHLDWDGNGRLLRQTDPVGRETSYTYDQAGNVTAVIGPDGRRAAAEYNSLHLPVVTIGADGAVRTYTYDERGNRMSVTEPGGAVTRFGFDAAGAVTSITDAMGATVSFVTDAAGLPTRMTGPTGAVVEYVRDAFGRPESVVDPLGGVTRTAWTVEGRPRERVAADGGAESWNWDPEGNLLSHRDAAGAVTTSQYSHFDLLVTRSHPGGGTLRFGHDTELRLTSVTNERGLTWHYTYDEVGRPVAEEDFNGRRVSYEHDEVGCLVRQVNGAGEVVSYLRDVNGNVVRKQVGDSATSFHYDDAGLLKEALSASARLTFEHDAYGRVTTETVNGLTSTFTYDLMGRRLTRVTPSGARSTFSYDADGRPDTLDAFGHALRFAHDQAGRQTEVRLDGAFAVQQSWDAVHRLRRQRMVTAHGRHGQDGAPAATIDRIYVHTPTGLTETVEAGIGDTAYTLNAAGRVTAIRADTWTEEYAYDSSGGLLSAHRSGAVPADEPPQRFTYAGNRLVGAGRARYAYDAQGRVVRRTTTTISGRRRSWSYAWDADDRLTQLVTPDGTTWRYAYDPLGRRISKERVGEAGQVAETVFFVWDGSRLAEEIRDGGRDGGAAGRTSTTWEYSPDSHRAVAQSRQERLAEIPQEEIDRRFRLIVGDLAGSPSEMVSPEGELTWKRRSLLWGEQEESGGRDEECLLRFPGQYFDAESGLHYNYFRYYDPRSARYLSPDPLGLAAGTDHYAYVINPLDWSDPLGLQSCPTFKGLTWLTDKLLTRPSFRYQRVVSGTDYEQIWKLADGRAVHVDGGPAHGWIMEAKFTGKNDAAWAKSNYNPESDFYNEDKITSQAAKLLELNEGLGGKGVRYAISNPAGAAHFREVIGNHFPEAIANGTLAVFHVPGNGMSGMSKWLT
ncbi:RHS repeat-associated core domain-containing protein, partial [Streptomyces sp. NPDC059627]